MFDPQRGVFVQGTDVESPALTLSLYSLTGGTLPPEGYEADILHLGGTTLDVWRDRTREGFYMVLAQNAEGEFGYYTYDSLEGTFQRFVESDETKILTAKPTPSPSPSPTPAAKKADDSEIKTWRTVAVIAIAAFILALGAMSLMLFTMRKSQHGAHAASPDASHDAMLPYHEDADVFDDDDSHFDPLN